MKKTFTWLALMLVLSQAGFDTTYAAITNVERINTDTASTTPRTTYAINGTGEFDMSSDGRYLTFISTSRLDGFNYQSSVVPYDIDNYFFPNYPGDIIHPEWQSAGYRDVVVYDTVEKKYELVSRVSNGRQSQYSNMYSPTISKNGRYVAFNDGGSSNLVEDDTQEPM